MNYLETLHTRLHRNNGMAVVGMRLLLVGVELREKPLFKDWDG